MKSIRSKITVLVMSCVLLCMGVMAGIDVLFVSRMQAQSSDQILSLACIEQTSKLNRELIDVEGSVDACADIVKDSLQRLESFDDDEAFNQCIHQLEHAVNSVAQNTTGVCTFYVRVVQHPDVEPAGFFYTKKGRDAALTKEPLTPIMQYDASDIEHVGWYYLPAVAGEAIWMEPYYNQNIDVYMVSYVAPIYIEGTFVGVTGMDINLDYIINPMRYIKPYGTNSAILTSEEGIIYYHPDAPAGSSLVEHSPELVGIVEELPSLKQGGHAYVATYNHGGMEHKIACSALRNNMVLMISAPVSDINAPLNNMLRSVFLAAVVVFSITMVAVIQFSRRMTMPLALLTDAAGRIAQGDLNVDLPEAGDDEVGMLTKSFGVTVESLRKLISGMSVKAYRDALTSVKNKAAYDEDVQRLEVLMQFDDVEFALVMLDVNGLKAINDEYGHDCGNEYLRACSQAICNAYDHSPVYRIGGDEFVVILQHADFKNREQCIVELERRIKESQSADEPWQRISIAMGMSVYQTGDKTVDDVFKRADAAMYDAKRRMKETSRYQSAASQLQTQIDLSSTD